MIDETMQLDLVSVFERYIHNLRSKKTKTHGGEYCGACPLPGCSSHDDAFLLWPHRAAGDGPLWSCRKCNQSGRLRKFLRLVDPHNYRVLCAELGLVGDYEPVSKAREEKPVYAGLQLAWESTAYLFAREAQAVLWDGSEISNKWVKYLKWRGFTEKTIKSAGLGLLKQTRYDPIEDWGVTDRKTVWLPRGVVIPWRKGDQLVKLNIRRPDTDIKRDKEEGKNAPKYVEVPGSQSDALYNADSVQEGMPLALLEGELDALALAQALSVEMGIVATGSVYRAFTQENVELLSTTLVQLIMYDPDKAGTEQALKWIEALPQAIAWRPYTLGSDVSKMLQDKDDIATWTLRGIDVALEAFKMTSSRKSDAENEKDEQDIISEEKPAKIEAHIEEVTGREQEEGVVDLCFYQECHAEATTWDKLVLPWCAEHAHRGTLLDMLQEMGWPKIIDGQTVLLQEGEDAALEFVLTASTSAFIDALPVVYRRYKRIPEPEPLKETKKVIPFKARKPKVACDYSACTPNRAAVYFHDAGNFCDYPGCALRYELLLHAEQCGYPEITYEHFIAQMGTQKLRAGREAYTAFAQSAEWKNVEKVIAVLAYLEEQKAEQA